MAEPLTGSAVLASFLAKAGATAKAAAPVVSAGAGVAGAAAALQKPEKPKLLSNPDPDDKKKRLDTERDLARRYANQGRVSSMFNKDKLG